MPIAYGEGRKAFFRLMQAIIEETSNVYIFSWKGTPSPYCSPSCYSRARQKINLDHPDLVRGDFVLGDTTFFMSKMKLDIKVLMVPAEALSRKHEDNGTDVFIFRVPKGRLEEFTVVFGERKVYSFNCYTTKNMALGILD